MQDQRTSPAEVWRVLKLAGLFGLFTGVVWTIAYGWRGALLGVVGAAGVVGIFVLSRLFSLRVALLVATLTVFLLLMLGAAGAEGDWP